MRLLTILARFGTDQYAEAEERLSRIFTRQMPTVERTIVVVDNALPRDMLQEQSGRVLVGGDNRVFEFSAFDRALDHIGPRISSFDLVHFATSAFDTLYTAYLDRFDDRLLAAIADRPIAVGHIDCYNEPVELLSFRSQHWMRSCFFIMPPTEARILGSFVSIDDGGRFFSGRPETPFRVDAPIGSSYQQYITDWLIGRDIGQGVEWHSSFALSDVTLPIFERKALSIMNEHLLAIRLRALGCRLVDVTWLSDQLSRLAPAQIEWSTDWRDQLAGRDRDAIRP